MSKDFRSLRRYERKKAQGLIIEKPCNVNDPVWIIEDGRIVPSIVTTIAINQSREMAEPLCEIAGPGFCVTFEEVGKTLFTKIEDAEMALEKYAGIEE